MKRLIFSGFVLLALSTPLQAQVAGGHEYVDLGLSGGVLWATCNMGAAAAEEAGDRYAWGEPTAKTTFTWDSYRFGPDLSKYNATDGKKVLDTDDDAVEQAWGGGWRMPTFLDIWNLYMYCTWTWTERNGVAGYEVKGNNGNSIFLAPTGYCDTTTVKDMGTEGYMWTKSLDKDTIAFALYFRQGTHIWRSTNRYLGLPIRPVIDKAAATGIDDVNGNDNGNGNRNANALRYNLQGQRVGADYRGIVVVGRRKLLAM